jgi:hypothetical protein
VPPFHGVYFAGHRWNSFLLDIIWSGACPSHQHDLRESRPLLCFACLLHFGVLLLLRTSIEVDVGAGAAAVATLVHSSTKRSASLGRHACFEASAVVEGFYTYEDAHSFLITMYSCIRQPPPTDRASWTESSCVSIRNRKFMYVHPQDATGV